MQNPIKKLVKVLLFLRNQVFCLKNWKFWWAPTTRDFINFFLKFCMCFLLTNVYKRVCGIFSVLFRIWVICQNKKDLVSTHSQKPGLSITQDLNKIKKIPHSFADIGKTKMCAKFQQKMLNSMVVGAHQSFQFFRQITWFLRNKRVLSKFNYWILHHLLRIIKLQNN